eukprot:9831762-Lingulodinium_polyedra.AAC.1
MGNCIVGRGTQALQGQAQDTAANREAFMQFVRANRFTISNTRFNKPNHKLITYKEKETQSWSQPWDAYRFATLDYILTPSNYKNTIKDAESNPGWGFNSDHCILEAQIK